MYKTGDKVNYYLIIAGKRIKQFTGVILNCNELACRILPDGKKTAVDVPIGQIMKS